MARTPSLLGQVERLLLGDLRETVGLLLIGEIGPKVSCACATRPPKPLAQCGGHGHIWRRGACASETWAARSNLSVKVGLYAER